LAIYQVWGWFWEVRAMYGGFFVGCEKGGMENRVDVPTLGKGEMVANM